MFEPQGSCSIASGKDDLVTRPDASLRHEAEVAGIALGRPGNVHGADIRRLIAECPPLDVNSTYAYLLLCEHFADTCVLARRAGNAVGFISGYRIPGREDTLFVWQVAIAAEARGLGLAKSMLRELLSRKAAGNCRWVETTVSPSNGPSRALFRSLARDLQAPLEEEQLFTESHFARESHESEVLIRIGPFAGVPLFKSSNEALR